MMNLKCDEINELVYDYNCNIMACCDDSFFIFILYLF